MCKNNFCIILIVSVLMLSACSYNKKTNTKNMPENIVNELPKVETAYIANKNTKKFHRPNCEAVDMMNDENKIYLTDDFQSIINKGYLSCAKCDPQ